MLAGSTGIWLELQSVAHGLDHPVYVTDAGDGSGRLFVVERGGMIRVVVGGNVLNTPFLDISADLTAETGERGMFGLAFHPRFEENGYFYVTYSRTSGDWVLRRFTTDPDANVAEAGTGKDVLVLPHPGETHYAGMVAFGPDGYLYASFGDGGHVVDEDNPAQSLESLLGAIIRIDVDGGVPYAIPPDNPFVGNPDTRPEIWVWGLRNPWRFSFDRLTGDLFIGDVGFESWEEINVLPAGSPGGANFGWPVVEGHECSAFAPGCDPAQFVLPVAEYSHQQGCAVSGGYVDRSSSKSLLYGSYLYGDFCNGRIWALSRTQDVWESRLLLDSDAWITSFGEDEDGNIYLTDFSAGYVYRLVASDTPPAPEILGIDPDPLVAGSVGCHFILKGANFQQSASVKINDQTVATRYIGSTDLLVTIPSAMLATSGPISVTVDDMGTNRNNPVTAGFTISDEGLADRAFQRVWERTDEPVATGAASRTWMWGPEGFVCAAREPYDEALDSERIVQYFDKSRMEVTNPDTDPDSGWYVTNGLLARELVTGELQLGDMRFEQRQPANIGLAGDFNADNVPSYATFRGLLSELAAEVGSVQIQRVDHQGIVSVDQTLAAYDVRAAEYVSETKHTVAGPFWQFLNLQGTVSENGELIEAPLFTNPFFATGFPITEAYWATVPVGGTPQDVLIQVFERRVLTYNPGNPPGWRVESANTGLHYYIWRYDTIPPDRQV